MGKFQNGDDHSKTLIFIIHGLKSTPKSIEDISTLAKNNFPDAIIRCPKLPHSSLFARIRATSIVVNLIDMINAEYESNDIDRIIIIGHSSGAVLARRVLIEASGLERTRPHSSKNEFMPKTEPEFCNLPKYEWHGKVELLLMMASISRGWSVEYAQSGLQKFYWNIGGLFSHLAFPNRKPTIIDFRRGSPFIVQTRLRWLEYCQKNKEKRADVIQLLGTVDEIVPPNDTIDFAADPTGKKFTQVEIPNTGHRSIIQLTPSNKNKELTETACLIRRKLLTAVLCGKTEEFKNHIVPREHMDDELPPIPDHNVKNLVFVVHGIRDKGYWTKKIAARVKSEAEKLKGKFVSRTPSYGYFPILPFLLSSFRRNKVEWLMDHFVEAAATYPKADFHYMGHSNGTYLGARALLDYPMVSFRRVMFAGSVVRTDFPWKKLVEAGRVEKIYNAVATSDIVVAVFPNGLQPLKNFFDLGGAGHKGFEEKQLPDNLFQLDYQTEQKETKREYVKGGHSAAKQESQWDEIAQFIVHGTPPATKVENPDFESKQPLFSRLLGICAPGIVFVIASIVITVGFFLFSTVFEGITQGNIQALGNIVGSEPTTQNPIQSRATLIDSLHSAWIEASLSAHIIWLAIYIWLIRFVALRF